jgi:hypothetical protein
MKHFSIDPTRGVERFESAREGRRKSMAHRHRRLLASLRIDEPYPDDEVPDDCRHAADSDNCYPPSTPGTMKTASSLESTRSRESVLVQVGQPFDESVSDDTDDDNLLHHVRLVHEEKKEEQQEPLTADAPSCATAVTPNNNKQKNARILMLMSTFGRSQLMHQERAMMLFESMGIPYETIDGSAPNRKDERNALFQLSGLRGIYPQFFLVQQQGGADTDVADAGAETTTGDNHDDDDGSNAVLSVIGNYDAIEGINEASSLPTDVLLNNPEILTWDRLMGKTKSERLASMQSSQNIR